jgi:two-component system, OmpR family, phosphate regulon response regulator PhoB
MMNSRHVLVVDDDQDIRDILELALGIEGYGVVLASDRSLALNSVREKVPAFILLDYYMHGLDPAAFIAELRNLKIAAPIFLMTAAHDGKEKAQMLGVDHLLPKPFDLDALVSLLREHSGCA